ncbi:Ubiquinone/menaquinone biosynthesis C-methyltransferase UbiE [Pirellulimonas nuda]|uniref:Ubiquinone/menaquinone biosynthesis C-methyltransferase UbiE n=1 Tax=Pirellulimonas nuda TaxID=2528009 RepID=A0A518D848_9BACT|nr:class I SAM-dependent methyltransferase [Pirellulimonas nuda]QDU87634.1 Ubiquinone/menaquinone biosynthesis C-methyltransferase UbiE [Pirellulimonas nuda]
MSALAQLKTLYHLTLSPIRGETHQERLDSFYGGQADDYDAFRKRMLHGREALFAKVDPPEGGVWLDLGSGTGSNAELMADRLPKLGGAKLVDLSTKLLAVANKRIEGHGWTNVEAVCSDVTNLDQPDNSVDLVTFTYSLTMIPDWFGAVNEAYRVLKPGGTIGVADFFIARKYPHEGHKEHSFFTRSFWPVWFSMDNVYPSADHLPYLANKFQPKDVEQHYGKLPWIPVVRAPYYTYVGTKAG